MLLRVAFSLLVFLSSLPALAADELGFTTTWPANVGRSRLELPIPDGYSEVTIAAPALRQFAERLLPQSNRLLAYFVSDADLNVLQSGQTRGLKRYFQVQTLRQTEGSQITTAEFKEARSIIREQYKQLLPKAAELMQPQIDAAVQERRTTAPLSPSSLRVGEIRGVEVFIDEEQVVSLLALTKVSTQTQAATVETPMVMAISTALIGGRLVYFYAYAAHTGPTDLEWAKVQSRAWLKKATSLNQ